MEDLIRQTIQACITEAMQRLREELLAELHAHVLAPLLVDTDQAARMLSLSRATIYELMESGELPSIRIGRARRIPVFALKAYIESKVYGREEA